MFCILASNSPRRQELLRQMGIDFTVFVADTDESCPGIPAEKIPSVLAQKKLDTALESLATNSGEAGAPADAKQHFAEADFVLAADTLIVLDGKTYGKPRNLAEAAAFLRGFSGKKHFVITAVAVYWRKTAKTTIKSVQTAVTFAPLSKKTITDYLECGEWKDAAGAYKIQGRGACLVSRIEGSYSGVVGLPIFELYDILAKSDV